MVLNESCVWTKLNKISASVEGAMQRTSVEIIPEEPARDVKILIPGLLPPKKGLSYREGQARLLHDLASIELQAMELGLRTLIEFPEAPQGFREELAAVTLSEGEHLKLCLQGIESLGFKWGDWPAHTMLWAATHKEDSLLDRVLIVHRYLEGSGLDAGETLLKRLDSVLDSPLTHISKTIVTEEIGHVEFGSRWYRELCRQEKLDPQNDFAERMTKLRWRLPKRIEKLSRKYRLLAGFNEFELQYLENLRNEICKYQNA
jgi:uncharacterized ferritin-like protein (DUF455 family)